MSRNLRKKTFELMLHQTIVYPARDQLNENMFQGGATKLVDGDELNWDSGAHVGRLLDLLRTNQERLQS